jgi:hypothetical protein
MKRSQFRRVASLCTPFNELTGLLLGVLYPVRLVLTPILFGPPPQIYMNRNFTLPYLYTYTQ